MSDVEDHLRLLVESLNDVTYNCKSHLDICITDTLSALTEFVVVFLHDHSEIGREREVINDFVTRLHLFSEGCLHEEKQNERTELR